MISPLAPPSPSSIGSSSSPLDAVIHCCTEAAQFPTTVLAARDFSISGAWISKRFAPGAAVLTSRSFLHELQLRALVIREHVLQRPLLELSHVGRTLQSKHTNNQHTQPAAATLAAQHSTNQRWLRAPGSLSRRCASGPVPGWIAKDRPTLILDRYRGIQGPAVPSRARRG